MKKLLCLAPLLLWSAAARAGETAFTPGPVLESFGAAADVTSNFIIPEGAEMRISFDVNQGAEAGALNRTLNAAARFINMHARAGMPPANIDVAVVVHGKAVYDVSNASRYEDAVGGENANAALVEALLEQNVRIIVCGQSAIYYDVTNDDLLPGVEMAISAMTAHVLLQQDGYALNPF